MPALSRDQATEKPQQVLLVVEADPRPLESAEAIDPDVVRPVDQHVGHRRIGKQRLERAQPENLGDDLVLDVGPFARRQVGGAARAERLGQDPAHPGADLCRFLVGRPVLDLDVTQ